jgi:hypothetical protein
MIHIPIRSTIRLPNKILFTQSAQIPIITIIMKWLLALVPLVAAAPALTSYQGDAPTPGQVLPPHPEALNFY